MIRIFKKDLKLFIKDKRAVFLTFLLPVILISLFALAFGGIGKDDDNKKLDPVHLLITDIDNSSASLSIINRLDSIEGLEVKTEELNKAKNLVNKGKYVGVLVLYKGFQDSLNNGKNLPIELLYDRAQEAQIGLLQPVLIGTLKQLSAKESINKGIAGFLSTNYPGMDKNLSDKIIKEIGAKLEKSENETNRDNSQLKMTSIVGEKKDMNLYLIQAIAGVAIMMLLFSISGLSSGLLEEKESGTLKRLLYSPVKPDSILLGKMLTAFTISLAQLTVMFVYAWLVFGLNITINLPALVLMILSTGFAVSSIGIFLASIARTRTQAQGLGTIVILTMSAIGGSMVPLYIMPAFMQKIAIFSVNYWGIQGFYDIFWRGLATVEIIPKVLVLLATGIVLTIVSLRLFKRNVTRLA